MGEVPAHWEVRRLRNLAHVRFSNVDKHSNQHEIGIRLCNYSDVYHNSRIRSDMEFMSATATQEEVARFHLVADDVLITKDSETWNDIGVPALIESGAEDLICGYHLALLRAFPNSIFGAFLYHALSSEVVASQFSMQANGVTRFGLSQNAVKSIWLPVPPISEQVAIVGFLDQMDWRIQEYIRAKQKLTVLLEEQQQVMIHDAVTGRIDVRTGKPYSMYKPFGVGDLDEIPKHWDCRPAKRHFREIDERSATGLEEELSVSHLTGVTPRSEKNVTMFKSESNIGHKTCMSGDLVINTMWAWMSALGMARQVGLVSPSYAVYRPISGSLLNRDYAELLLRSTPYQAQFRMLSTGIRPSRMRLYPEVFLRVSLVCPPPEEQVAIIAFVESKLVNADRASDTLRNEVARLQEFRTRLIADVVTGKLDVRGAADALRQGPTAQEFTSI